MQKKKKPAPPSPPPPPLLGSCPVRPIECPRGSRKSIIVITSLGQGIAGLFDRFVMLSGIAALASSLCARVFPARPCPMLANAHYGGILIPCDHSWGRYLRIGSAHEDDEDGGSSGRISTNLLADRSAHESLSHLVEQGRAPIIGSQKPLVPQHKLRWPGMR